MRQQRTALQFFRIRPSFLLWTIALIATLLLAVGCAPQIGDACEANDDCPSGASCDRSVDGGFCTITGCRAGECPSESICVEFARHTSYCMRSCEHDDDCRDDHRCIEDQEKDVDYCFVAE